VTGLSGECAWVQEEFAAEESSTRSKRRWSLQAIEIGADFGIGPVGCPNEFPPDVPFTVDDVGFRPHVGIEELGGRLVGVAHGDEVDVAPSDEVGVRDGVFVDADGENNKVGILVMELQEGRKLLNTWRALTPPEIEQDYLSTIACKVNRGGTVGDIEIGSNLVGLCGTRAAVAAGSRNNGEQTGHGEKTGKPHILIILSDGYRAKGQ
jgi:hypothetical protein